MNARGMFCTAAGTRNAHVLAVLPRAPLACPPTYTHTAPKPLSAAGAAFAAAIGASDPQWLERFEVAHAVAHRETVLGCCLHVAAYLLRPLALVALRLPGTLPYVSTACLDAARKRLEACSTRGAPAAVMQQFGLRVFAACGHVHDHMRCKCEAFGLLR